MSNTWINLNKKGQVAIFVIIAILIAAGVATYFIVRNVSPSTEGTEFKDVFDYYGACIEQQALAGLDILGSQGGRMNVDFIPGSEYAPFSNQLNFLGFPVPYWFYISGNGIVRENVPTKEEMQLELAEYVQNNIGKCDFDSFAQQGFSIDLGNPEVKVQISDEYVLVNVANKLSVYKEDSSSSKEKHEVSVKTKFGKFFKLAKKFYDYQKEYSFVENFALDALRLYAPVDGVEIQCAPKVWKTREVVNEFKNALEANINSLSFSGSYASDRDYFVVPASMDAQARLLYSKSWPSKFEIYGEGVDQELMVAEAIGNQEGMGMMGFCYVPYHFVYDTSFPVMFQVYEGNELFQFPFVVIIDKNVPRQGMNATSYAEEGSFDLCEYPNQDIEVSVKDNALRDVGAEISYSCFNQMCKLGPAVAGRFVGKAPSCLNGYIIAKADGYSTGRTLFSSNKESYAEVFVDKMYNVKINLNIDGRPASGVTAIVSFSKENGTSTSAILPGNGNVSLSEGSYESRVYIYGNSSIVIPKSSKKQCTEVPREGLLGYLGMNKEQCYNIEIPETKMDYALIGGGVSQIYVTEGMLQKGSLDIDVKGLPRPTSLEQLQNNFEAFESQGVDVK